MSRQGINRPPTRENIRRFWDNEAAELGESPAATIRDLHFRTHELHTLLAVLPRGERLLDVGCGTGFGTLCLSRRAAETVGLDFSPDMVAWAQKLLSDPHYLDALGRRHSPLWPVGPAAGWVRFAVGDVLALGGDLGTFDVVTGQRILINMPSHDDQLRALEQLRGRVAVGGVLYLVEATVQGHATTDAFRARFGLSPLEKYWHNRYVDESRFDSWERSGWLVKRVLAFDTYALLSKVVYPAAVGEGHCEFVSGANAAAMEVACLFRSRQAVAEIGLDSLLDLYIERVRLYEPATADAIERWLPGHRADLGAWQRLGHQVLIACIAL